MKQNQFITLLVLSIFLVACKNEAVSNPVEEITKAEKIMVEQIMKERIAEVSVTVPDSRWSVSISKVTQMQDHIAVIAKLKQSDGMGMMVISQVSDAVSFTSKDLPIKYYVLGKSWNWENSEEYQFVSSVSLPDGNNIDFIKVAPTKRDGPKQNEM